jgi:hypothetical protein
VPEGGQTIRFLRLVDDSEGGIDPSTGEISIGYLKNNSSDHAWHMIFWNLQDSGSYAQAVNLTLGPASSFPMQVEIEFWAGGVGSTTFCARRLSGTPSEVCTGSLDMENADVDSLIVGAFVNSNPGGYTGSYSVDEFKTSF